jgi:multidrug efflux pump subunit AcrB
MLSQFFINRPIFACVISLFILLVGGISIPLLPIEKTPDITPPTVEVTATYPGASAQVIADTVAAPIEEEVNGVDNMIYMSSQSASDGSMNLTVTFEVGTDVDMSQVLVQNRVAIAEPLLPEDVRRQGVKTEKKSTNLTIMVNLISPDDRYDELYFLLK